MKQQTEEEGRKGCGVCGKCEDCKMWKETFKHNNTPIVIEYHKWGHLIYTGTLMLKYRKETQETFCLNKKGEWKKWPVFNPKMENWRDGKKLAYNL